MRLISKRIVMPLVLDLRALGLNGGDSRQPSIMVLSMPEVSWQRKCSHRDKIELVGHCDCLQMRSALAIFIDCVNRTPHSNMALRASPYLFPKGKGELGLVEDLSWVGLLCLPTRLRLHILVGPFVRWLAIDFNR